MDGSGSSPSISSATYNSVSMTVEGNELHSETDRGLGMVTLKAPATGANTLTITFDATVNDACCCAVSATDVDQTTAFGTAAFAQGESTTASVDVSAATNDLVVDFAGINAVAGETWTPGAGQTERNEQQERSDRVGTSTEAGATTVTMSWDVETTARKWITGGIAFKAAAAGGGSSQTTPILSYHQRSVY